jgi:hypothetical protein
MQKYDCWRARFELAEPLVLNTQPMSAAMCGCKTLHCTGANIEPLPASGELMERRFMLLQSTAPNTGD